MQKEYLKKHDNAISSIQFSADELQDLGNAAYELGQERLGSKLQKIADALEYQASNARSAVSESINHEFNESVRGIGKTIKALVGAQ